MTHAEAVLRSLRAVRSAAKPPFRVEIALATAECIEGLPSAERHAVRAAITTATADLVGDLRATAVAETVYADSWSFYVRADPARRVVRVSHLSRMSHGDAQHAA